MSSTFNFTKNFQLSILGLCLQEPEVITLCADIVKPSYFEDSALAWYFTKIRDYFLDYKVRPSHLVLEEELFKACQSGRIKDDHIPAYLEVLKKTKSVVDSKEYILDQVIRFCRRQEVRKTFLDCAPLTDSDDEAVWDQIEADVRKACNTGLHTMDMGTNYLPEFAERLEAREKGEEIITIPTGIPDLDININGGLKAAQLGIVMGGSGKGKSLMLNYFGMRAMLDGKKVIHYTLELPEAEIARRYDASFSGIPLRELEAKTTQVSSSLKSLHAKFNNSLIIKEFPMKGASVNTLRSHMIMLKGKGFVPDLALVDYAQLLRPTEGYGDLYIDQGTVCEELCGFGTEFQIPVWSAIQPNREGIKAEVMEMHHASDSIKQVFPASVIIAMQATEEELQNNLMRLHGVKNRNGVCPFTIKIKTNYSQAKFFEGMAPTLADISPPPTLN